MTQPGMTYASAGVDIDAADASKHRIKALVESTFTAGARGAFGGFGGMFRVPAGARAPLLVSSADGVGTKIKVAIEADRHDTIGHCLVNHCVNDILVQGARPLFFLDYLATGAMDEAVVTQVVSGVAVACRENACALLGGETAQMPDFYAADEYDLAGFIVGIVERDRVLDGGQVREGDVLLGLASSGLHTNGYTLARRIVFDVMGLRVDDEMPGTGRSVADELLAVHRSYLGVLWPLLAADAIRGLAHITGGGIPGNLPRVLPAGLGAVVDRGAWTVPPVFRALQEGGRVDRFEMDRVFNMGVGMVVLVRPDDAEATAASIRAAGVEVWPLGQVEKGDGVRYLG